MFSNDLLVIHQRMAVALLQNKNTKFHWSLVWELSRTFLDSFMSNPCLWSVASSGTNVHLPILLHCGVDCRIGWSFQEQEHCSYPFLCSLQTRGTLFSLQIPSSFVVLFLTLQ
jgi:hypothetical protein